MTSDDLSMPRIAVVLQQTSVRMSDERLALYFSSLIDAGAFPFALPKTQDKKVLSFMIGQADGLLISGGMDIDPAFYREAAHEKTVYDTDYDRHCFAAFEIAKERKIPILGICRGEQLMNVACGGTLIQDVPGHRDTLHALKDISGRVAQTMGTEGVTVNSFHHQVIGRLAGGFAVTARSPEGYVEAIEHVEYPYMVGIQWHPERLHDDGTTALLRDFIRQCKR